MASPCHHWINIITTISLPPLLHYYNYYHNYPQQYLVNTLFSLVSSVSYHLYVTTYVCHYEFSPQYSTFYCISPVSWPICQNMWLFVSVCYVSAIYE